MARTEPEVEWQFDAVDLRPVQRWLGTDGSGVTVAATATLHRQVDVYVDTKDWRLYRGGYSLRLRRKDGALEATLKSLEPPDGALRRRTELSAPARSADIDELAEIEGPLGRLIRAITGTHPLQIVVEIQTRRRAFDLTVAGNRVGEIALDATTIPMSTGEGPARLRRVEVEVAPDAVDRIRPFVESLREACGLSPALMSKLEAGLLAAGQSPPAALALGPTEIRDDMSTGELAFAALRSKFAMFLSREPGTRLGDDPEELHQQRVASRRTRAALAVFAGALPVRARRFREEFRWVASVLGRVRDLDVQLSELDRWERNLSPADRPTLEVMRTALLEERKDAEAAMISALDSSRYDRLIRDFTTFLRRGPLRRSAASQAAILALAPEIVSSRYRKLRRAATAIHRGSVPEDYHALRIRTKRLRYALEFFVPVYGAPTKRLIDRLIKLQDLLGDHQDANVALQRLRFLVDSVGPELPPSTVFAMGRIAERNVARAEELRGQFEATFRPVAKRWRPFRRRMMARRPAGAAIDTRAEPSSPQRSPGSRKARRQSSGSRKPSEPGGPAGDPPGAAGDSAASG